MKRYGNLWPQIIAFENLLEASRKAQRGKRFRPNVLAFNHDLEGELFQLQRELQTQTYCPGPYRNFEITDPKPRIISAAPYRDRVVHHALCNIIVPLLDRTFIDDTYANRLGYGTHRALRRFTQFARSSRYVLQCDIRKYFPSIDLEILKRQLRRRIKCRPTQWLIETIIDSNTGIVPPVDYFPGDTLLTPLERRRGLPIGNLTSQFFANLYLSDFDHFVKEGLQCSKYLRYVDDFALFEDDWGYLHECRHQIEDYLATLRLRIHPIKSQLIETKHGANFVGFRVLPHQIRVRNDNLRRGRRRLKELQQGYADYTVSYKDLIQRLTSWDAHLQHGDTYRVRRELFDHTWFRRGSLHPKKRRIPKAVRILVPQKTA